MYYQSYEDYIRSILGYPMAQNVYADTYASSNSMMISSETEYLNQTPMYSSEIMDLYPEIYKIINPMVCKICEANTKPITKELIDAMTEEIYMNLESDPSVVDTINVRVNLPKEENKESNRDKNSTQYKVQAKSNLNTTSSLVNSGKSKDTRPEKSARQERVSNSLSKQDKIVETSDNVENSNVQGSKEYRQIRRNTTLQDLIRILILNQLLGGNRRPPRPRPRPPRPPYPGRPGQNPRPPFPGGGRIKS